MKTTQKIRYRLVYNYANYTRKDGAASIALECRQGTRKIYMTSNITVLPYQWDKGRIQHHDNADKLTVYLVQWMHSIEEIELNALLKGKSMSLGQLKMSVKNGLHESANLKEFALGVIENSDRRKSTKRGYEYLVSELEAEYGKLTLEDISYEWILQWKTKMQNNNLSANTVKGRLKMLHTIINEAIKRNLLSEDPFKYITIGNMTPKAVYLNMKEVKKIEKVEVKGKEAKIRDLFLLGVYSGLRWSDLSTLEEAKIKDGVLRKVMKKTNHEVVIPVKTLFWGKGLQIIEKYSHNIRAFSHCCCNATANKIIKEVARKAGVNKPVSFHWARKSCSSNLQMLGMSIGEISTILGHADTSVTRVHYLFSQDESVAKQSKKIFKQKQGENNSDSEQNFGNIV